MSRVKVTITFELDGETESLVKTMYELVYIHMKAWCADVKMKNPPTFTFTRLDIQEYLQ